MEKFAIGVLIGGMAGALLCANNYKMRALVKKGQQEVQNKFDQMMDEKLQSMQSASSDESEGSQSETKKSAKKSEQ